MPANFRQRIVGLPLAHKLTIFATGTSVTALFVLAGILGWVDAADRRGLAVNSATAIAATLAANGAAAVAVGDAAAANDVLAALSAVPGIADARFRRLDGTSLATYTRESSSSPGRSATAAATGSQLAGPQSAVSADGLSVVITAPVVLTGDTIGALDLTYSLADIRAQTTRLWRLLALTMLGTATAAAWIAWRLQPIISTPLMALAEATRAVTRDRNYAIRAPRFGDDEVGELVDRFNEMLADLQQRDLDLAQHRELLERTVETRTNELKANLDRFRMLMEGTRAVPWEADGETFVVTYISPQVSQLTALHSGLVIGRLALWELAQPDDRERLSQQLRDLVAEGVGANGDLEYRLVTSGYPIQVRTSASVHDDAGRIVLRGLTVDVTKQKALEFELAQAQKLESVGRLAAGVAHEINTPVQFVSDSVHFVRDAMADLTTADRGLSGACTRPWPAPVPRPATRRRRGRGRRSGRRPRVPPRARPEGARAVARRARAASPPSCAR